MPKISRADGPSYKGHLEPTEVEDQAELERESAEATGEREAEGDGIEREQVGGDDDLLGDGTGEALPPVDTDPDSERDVIGVTKPTHTDGGNTPAPTTTARKSTKAGK